MSYLFLIVILRMVYIFMYPLRLGFGMSFQRFKKEEVAVFNWPVCGNVAKSRFEISKSVECQVIMKTYIRFLMKSEHARLEDVTFGLVSVERHRISKLDRKEMISADRPSFLFK